MNRTESLATLIPAALLLLLCSAGASRASADAAGAQQWFEKGNRQYHDGQFRQAVGDYETAGRMGLVSPELEYNLANARLKSGQLGRAIAGYQRARRLGLEDSDVLESLRYARSLTRDARPPDVSSRPERALRRIAAGFPSRAAFLAGWGALVLSALLGLFGRAGGRAMIAGWAWPALILGIALQAGAAGRQFYLDGHAEGAILGAEVPLRSGPGLDFPSNFSLHEGALVRLHASAGPWTEVEFSPDVSGWVPSGSLERI